MKISEWRKISGYRGRDVIRRVGKICTVGYRLPGPDTLKGKNIVFFSDLHGFTSEKYLDQIRSSINEPAPDWIVFTGDLSDFNSARPMMFEFLSSLEAASAKISVLGNWDRRHASWKSLAEWTARYKNAGFNLLVNQSREADGVFFYGFDDAKRGNPKNPDHQFSQTQCFKCLAAHNPESIVQTQTRGVDLALAGHTHAGQVRIPGFGAIKTSTKYWKKFEYGLFIHEIHHTYMIVSSGLGTSFLPMRFFCEPEIVRLTFNPK